MTISAIRQALVEHLGKVLTPECAADIEQAALSGSTIIRRPVEPAPPWEIYSEDGLRSLLQGNADAARLVVDIAHCSHAYDDLIDDRTHVSDARVHDLMWRLLIGLPTNPFYRAHQDLIHPLIVTGILNWKAATDMEAGAVLEELRISHALRYAIADVVLMCMAILGGHQYAMANARRARLMGQNDTWANYLAEHLSPEHHDADPHQD